MRFWVFRFWFCLFRLLTELFGLIVGGIDVRRIGVVIQMTDRICGAQNPRNTLIVCTKREGHEGRHGKADMPYRSVLWDMRRVPAAVE